MTPYPPADYLPAERLRRLPLADYRPRSRLVVPGHHVPRAVIPAAARLVLRRPRQVYSGNAQRLVPQLGT
jgi:hypothetical protein